MDVPVLFFFTGLHTDYHKPSDDFNKINYNGELLVIKCIENIITASQCKRQTGISRKHVKRKHPALHVSVYPSASCPITLSPVRASVQMVSVITGRAQKAGIKAGDVIIQLGEYSISSMESYMQALSRYKKGDSTTVKFKRGNDTLEGKVTF